MQYKRLLRVIFGTCVLGIAFYYLATLVRSHPDAIGVYLANIPIKILLLAVLLSWAGDLINAIVWHRVNRTSNLQTRFKTSYWAWSAARIFRYIPGKAAGYYVRHKLQSTHVSKSVYHSLTEFVLYLVAILWLISLYLALLVPAYSIIALVCATASIVMLFAHPIVQTIEGPLVRRLKLAPPSKSLLSPRQMMLFSVSLTPALLLHGTAFYLIVSIGMGLEDFDLLQATVTLFISGILAQLSLIAPGGLGVREAAVALIMSLNGFEENLALAAAVIARIVLLTSELLNVATAAMYGRIAERLGSKTPVVIRSE
ncbi:MAG: hypothetical protein HOM55_11005 [Proteobacteria bacterium]|nr:hypothetical protein [Pseudomonadota bacterium]